MVNFPINEKVKKNKKEPITKGKENNIIVKDDARKTQ